MIALLVDIVFDLYMVILLVRVIVSWVGIRSTSPWMIWLLQLTEPILHPIRSRLPRTGGLDFSPAIALLAMALLRNVLIRILS